MGVGGARGPREDSERTGCGISSLVVIGILARHIAQHAAFSLGGCLTRYSKQRSLAEIELRVNDQLLVIDPLLTHTLFRRMWF